MKKRFCALICVFISILYLCACTRKSDVLPNNKPSTKSTTFSIQFIDVGQGDAALVECDGHNMLIDAGDKSHGEKVYSVLQEKQIQHLDILAISHLHEDHIGGLIKALTYASKIDLTLSNSDYRDNQTFREVEHQLGINEAKITIPHTGDKFRLGSAEIEVIGREAFDENDSLVLLITYGKTSFLFTGDIQYDAQKRIYEKYANDQDKPFKIDLIKMPHHGSYEGSLYYFVRTFEPDYAIISVGKENTYGHPFSETLDLLDQAEVKKVYRTDIDGDITVKSNGKALKIVTNR
jgi:competence protein ComEC